jgi:hypothetical protein
MDHKKPISFCVTGAMLLHLTPMAALEVENLADNLSKCPTLIECGDYAPEPISPTAPYQQWGFNLIAVSSSATAVTGTSSLTSSSMVIPHFS